MEKSEKIDLGNVQVHQKVFAEIILSAINEIDGVQLIQKNIGNRLFEIFGKKEFPGVDIKVDDKEEVTLELQIVVRYGLNIPDAARRVQKAVKSAIDKALDVSLKDINVNVQGIARGVK